MRRILGLGCLCLPIIVLQSALAPDEAVLETPPSETALRRRRQPRLRPPGDGTLNTRGSLGDGTGERRLPLTGFPSPPPPSAAILPPPRARGRRRLPSPFGPLDRRTRVVVLGFRRRGHLHRQEPGPCLWHPGGLHRFPDRHQPDRLRDQEQDRLRQRP